MNTATSSTQTMDEGTSMNSSTATSDVNAPTGAASTPPRGRESASLDQGFHPELADVGPVPFTRLVRVELRKLVDTRAGRGVLLAILGVTVVAMAAVLWVSRETGAELVPLLLAANMPQALLLPVLGVMTAANEWSQRTALVTFSQEPRRLRVMLAKAVSAVLLGLGVLVITVGVAMLGHALSMTLVDGGQVDLAMGWAFLANLTFLQVQGVLMGIAFGALVLSVPLGIVAFFLVPVVTSIVTMLSSWLTERAVWFDMSAANLPLLGDNALTAQQWAHVGSTTALWVLLPLAIGFWRVSRKEVK